LAIVGIDLGTTYSLVAVYKDGLSQILPNVLGARLTPSVVGLDDDGQVLVGQAAKERLITHPDLTVATFKRFMGTNRVERLGSRDFRPEELSSFVLRSLKADAEAVLGERVDEAVISVPAYFADAQRRASWRSSKVRSPCRSLRSRRGGPFGRGVRDAGRRGWQQIGSKRHPSEEAALATR
jgi:molecular chaperone HscC